jgi:hypothetical protein
VVLNAKDAAPKKIELKSEKKSFTFPAQSGDAFATKTEELDVGM